jgi:16S rRNA (cytosine1402-N4)-methyltransferase
MTGGDAPPVHRPVMLAQVLEYLDPRPGASIVDCTVGGGGHAAAILERIGPQGRLLGIDRDGEALGMLRARHRDDPRLRLVHGDYRDLPSILGAAGMGSPDGVLADLGVSTAQLLGPGRGFAFSRDEPLDMRMDRSDGPTAAEWLEAQDEAALERALREYGEESAFAGRIARAVLRRRNEGRLRSTGDLAEAVRGAIPAAARGRIDRATKTFQAIRIAVNDELRGLREFVERGALCLHPGGRLVIVTFHSLEDRPVKLALRGLAAGCVCPPDLPTCGCGHVPQVHLLLRRALRPSPAELAANPRARSARLRAAQRLDAA